MVPGEQKKRSVHYYLISDREVSSTDLLKKEIYNNGINHKTTTSTSVRQTKKNLISSSKPKKSFFPPVRSLAPVYLQHMCTTSIFGLPRTKNKERPSNSPSAAFLPPPHRLPAPAEGFFHPRQLLHTLSGSELQLHSESSSNRSESSKLNLSPSSHSSIAAATSPPPPPPPGRFPAAASFDRGRSRRERYTQNITTRALHCTAETTSTLWHQGCPEPSRDLPHQRQQQIWRADCAPTGPWLPASALLTSCGYARMKGATVALSGPWGFSAGTDGRGVGSAAAPAGSQRSRHDCRQGGCKGHRK
ncbi:hypothetical protein Zmor_027811 [Zophobas morio]|uniref:Uncharacterized protein n=1 Tax=Zophobas morio TaxID=2755281 RepID=A0AA38HPZ3_9CUCU|nr:hypothetical protein Zmor_027811 [Zophobas morio]